MKMMKHSFLLVWCFLAGVSLFSDDTVKTYVNRIFPSGEGTYGEIILDRHITTRASRDLRDIRIINNNTEPAAYFIYDSRTFRTIDDNSFTAVFMDSFLKDGFEYFDFRIIKPENTDVFGNHLELETANSGYAETIGVLGSHDGINWTPVTEGFIYDVRTFSEKTIPLGRTEKYSYYRIRAAEHTLKPESLKLVYTGTSESRQFFIDEFSPEFEIREKDKNTVITIPGEAVRFLFIDSIVLDSGDIFQRKVDTPFRRDEIYQFPFRGEMISKKHIPIGKQHYDDDLTITIFNGDDKPIDIKNITIYYRFFRLVFNAQEGTSFAVYYGDSSLPKPVYDIKNYGSYILKEGTVPCILGPREESPRLFQDQPAPQPAKNRGKLFLNIAIILAALVLLVVIIAGLRKSPGGQE